MRWYQRFFRRGLTEKYLDAELRFHLDQRIADLVSAGIWPEEARRRAQLEFGGLDQVKEECRDVGGSHIIETFIQDLKYGLRMLRKNPGFTAVAVLTLALGIGANTAMFSVIDAALLRPLPYDRPEQLVSISAFHLNGNPRVVAPDFRIWQEQSKDFESLGAFSMYWNPHSQGANITGSGEPSHVRAASVTVGFFRMLGVKPVVGRDFNADEGKAGQNQVALLSAAVWRRDFGGDPNVLSKTVHLDGMPFTIVGIMPAGLLYPPGDLWVPLVLDDSNSLPQSADWPMLNVIGRLKRDASLERARGDLEVLMHRIDAQFSSGRSKSRARWHADVIPLRQLLAGDLGHLLLILLAAVGFVLLIACANLANLMLARVAARGKEVAVRSALGAGRTRLVRQFLAESVMLSIFGGLLGAAIGVWSERGMKQLIPPELPADITLDPRILLFVIGISACAVILFGLAPALSASRVDVNEALKEAGERAGPGLRTHRVRNLLVVAETALAVILLAGAGLLARSLWRLTSVSLGFDPHHLLLGEVNLPISLTDQPQRQADFFHQALNCIRALPGVENAAATTHYPVSMFNGLASGVVVRGGPPPDSNQPVSIADISPGYFHTVRIPLLKGRDFTEQDRADSRQVVILNEAEARRAFEGRDPVGSEISMNGTKGPWREVVGVVADSRNYTLDRQPWPEIYLPSQQDPTMVMYFVLRTRGEPMAMLESFRLAVASVDANVPVARIDTMDGAVEKLVAPARFKMLLLGSFAVLALALGGVGLYGVISYAVTQRTHEIGVRVALGANRRDILRLVLGDGMRLTLAGIVVGIIGALGLTRFLSSLLFGVTATDPLTFVLVSVLLTVVAVVASYLPARRATKVDPMVALRYE